MPERFTLSIELGNAEMQAPEDVAAALRDIATYLDGVGTHAEGWHLTWGRVRDANGNTVGEWDAA